MISMDFIGEGELRVGAGCGRIGEVRLAFWCVYLAGLAFLTYLVLLGDLAVFSPGRSPSTVSSGSASIDASASSSGGMGEKLITSDEPSIT